MCAERVRLRGAWGARWSLGAPIGATGRGLRGAGCRRWGTCGVSCLCSVCDPPASHPTTQEFENTEGDDYVTELSAQGSPAPQHGPEVYVLPLTKVSLPMAKQPGRSGKPRRCGVGMLVMVLVGPPMHRGWGVPCHWGAGRGQQGGVRTVGRGDLPQEGWPQRIPALRQGTGGWGPWGERGGLPLSLGVLVACPWPCV